MHLQEVHELPDYVEQAIHAKRSIERITDEDDSSGKEEDLNCNRSHHTWPKVKVVCEPVVEY